LTILLDEPDRTRLPRSPLELVVCQIRFESRALVSDAATATAFQRALGGTDGPFPEIGEAATGEVNFAVAPGSPGAVTETQRKGWRFSSGQTLAAVLMPDHVTLETTDYSTWEEFFPLLERVVDAAAEVVSPAIEQRIGLRYVDRIQELNLRSPEEWRPYIRSELLGPILHEGLGSAIRQAHQSLLLDLGEGTNCGLRHGPVEDPNRDSVDYVLDFDVFRQSGRPFDTNAIKETASRFNTLALKLFQATITEELLDYLRGL
jgi:uncharacterized protein (TIGR04255 family)